MDRQADFENLHYDSVYSGRVAVYRRKFDCLGLKPNQKLKWNDGRMKFSRKKKRLETNVRYYTVRLSHAPSESAIPRTVKGTRLGTLSDFIKLDANLIPAKEDELTVDRHISQLTGEYNRSLLEEPHNVGLWLEFLALQDQLSEWGGLPGETSDKVGHRTRALLERKLSIIARALEQNPTSEELLIEHMLLVQEVWTTQEIVKKWKDIVFVQPNRPLLWLNYICFCQNNFSSFSTTSLITLYRKCITTLCSINQGTLKSHLPVPNTPSYLLAIFSLYCHFLHQVGLTERAVASYQALVEFNLCTPSELGEDEKSLREFFEMFWDSGSPRLGEAKAMGWCNWMKQTTSKSDDVSALGLIPHKPVASNVEATPADEDGEGEDFEAGLVAGLPTTEAWLKLEEHRMVHSCFPWQPDSARGETEDSCSDPDRMVTFDDVSQTLFRVREANLKKDLVASFLNFLGAPVESPFQSMVDTTTSLQSVYNITPHQTLGASDAEGNASPLLGIGQTFSCPSGGSLMEYAEFLAGEVLSDSASGRRPVRTLAVQEFISNVCNHSLSVLPSPEHQTEIARVWLTFLFQQLSHSAMSKKDSKTEIRSIQKLFKSLLRLDQHRNNLTLWNCYSQFEYSVGNFKEAKSLFQSILTQYPVPSAALCCSLCECFLGLRRSLWGEVEVDREFSLHALLSLAEGKNVEAAASSPSTILRARSHFSQKAGMSADWCTMVCYGYFEYLTRGGRETCAVFDECSDRLVRRLEGELSKEEKAVTLFSLNQIYGKQLQLLEHHSLSHPVQPSLFRRAVEKALKTFPDSRKFTTAFVRSERQTFISGRMRRHFDHASPLAKTPTTWLLAVAAELDRYCRVTGRLGGVAGVEEMSVGTLHRVRSLLARAGAAENSRHCPLLWRIYMAVQVCFV